MRMLLGDRALSRVHSAAPPARPSSETSLNSKSVITRFSPGGTLVNATVLPSASVLVHAVQPVVGLYVVQFRSTWLPVDELSWWSAFTRCGKEVTTKATNTKPITSSIILLNCFIFVLL